MMKNNKIEQETIVKIREILKDFGSKRMRVLKQLDDDSWVAKLMGCNEKVVTTAFNNAAHDFSAEDDAQKLVMSYAGGMNKCKTRLDKGDNMFDKVRKFVNGVTNCYAAATNQSKDSITDEDKLFTIWLVKLIRGAMTADSSNKADTFTAQPKQPKTNGGDKTVPKPNVKPTLISKWVDIVDGISDPVQMSLIKDGCSLEIRMYVCDRDDNDATAEVFERAPMELRPVSEYLAKLIVSKSQIVHDVIARTDGFVGQMCEILRLTGYKGDIKLTDLTYADTYDSYSYEYKKPTSVLRAVLDKTFGGDVMGYLAG